jgi:predicted signal transduction protein with EAL and GGDEF domain
VSLIDVDHFKAVNDTFGHAAGNEVLRVLGAILQATVRPSDLAVRRGGDEFMLLIDLPPGVDAPIVAHGIVRAVARHRWADVAAGLAVGVSAVDGRGPRGWDARVPSRSDRTEGLMIVDDRGVLTTEQTAQIRLRGRIARPSTCRMSKRLMGRVSAAHEPLLRARRDSNPQPSDP